MPLVLKLLLLLLLLLSSTTEVARSVAHGREERNVGNSPLAPTPHLRLHANHHHTDNND